MKIKIQNDKYIIFLTGEELKKYNFETEENIEMCIKEVFHSIKKINHEISGEYNVCIYLNKKCTAIEIIKNDNNIYEYINNKVDTSIKIVDSYVLEEYANIYVPGNYYLYENKYYKIYDGLNIEFFDIKYGDIVDEIINNGKLVCIK